MKYSFHEPTAYCRWRKCLLIMKLTLILLIAFVLHAGAKGTAQTVTLSVKDMPLEKVCKEIEKQTGYSFVYSTDLNKGGHLVSVKVDRSSIEEVLHMVFDRLPFTWRMIDKVVVVNTAKQSLDERINFLNIEPDKPITVSGEVFNLNGQPVSAATVIVKGTGKSTATDVQGKFAFTTPVPVNSILVISHIGYSSQEVTIKNEKSIRVRLEIAVSTLDATVVKGYYNTSERLNTGNVSTVKGEDIAKQPVTDPLLALAGRVAGLYIQQTSGNPGSYSAIYLRGQNSLPGAGKPGTVNDPLFIIDGVPYSSASLTSSDIGGGAVGIPGGSFVRGLGLSPFNNLNPADIESIDVLKDADATAIYGSRGSNGVILISTKKGKIGQTKIDINVRTGGSRVSKKIDLLNTPQYLQMRREAMRNDQTIIDPGYDFDLIAWDTTRYTDWQKVLIGNTAHFTDAQVSISGGNTNTQFLVSGGYSRQSTVFPGDYDDRKASIHFNINHASSDQRFRLQFSGGYSIDDNRLPMTDFTSSILLAPNAPAVYDAKGNLNWEFHGATPTWFNPFAGTYIHANANTGNLLSNLVISYQIINGLQIKASAGYNASEMNQAQLFFGNAVPPPGNLQPLSRSNSIATGGNKVWILEPQLDFHKQINRMTIDFLLGSTFQKNMQSTISTRAYGFTSDALVPNPLLSSFNYLSSYGQSEYRYNAIFGRLSCNWNNEFLLNLTGRRDGSSRFGPDRLFGNFGAVGVGWIFSSESFIQEKLPVLSFGKLRASYGVTGNDQIGDYQFLSTYSGNGITYQGGTGLYPTALTNPYFAWEQDKKVEGGIELGFLKDRILITTSYYRNRTGNQLVGYPLPSITGFSSVEANLPAVIQNSGWEFTLTSTNFKGQNFSWTSSINLSISSNKLVAYPGIQSSPYRFQYQVGKSLFTQYLYHFTGVSPQTGMNTFANKNGSNTPDFNADQYFTKSLAPMPYGGFQNTFRYKGWNLDLFFQFARQKGFNYLKFFNQPGLPFSNLPTEALNRWKKIGDIATLEKFSNSFDAYLSYITLQGSDATLTDASFIRLKNVALSYQFSSKWMKQAHLQNMSVYLHCENIFTLTKLRLLDPESPGLGLPPLRTITAGLNIGF